MKKKQKMTTIQNPNNDPKSNPQIHFASLLLAFSHNLNVTKQITTVQKIETIQKSKLNEFCDNY
jgi:hypothetical protein